MLSMENLPPFVILVERREDHLLAKWATLCDGGSVVLGLRAHQSFPPPCIAAAAGRRGAHLSGGQHLVWTNIHDVTKRPDIVFINPTLMEVYPQK